MVAYYDDVVGRVPRTRRTNDAEILLIDLHNLCYYEICAHLANLEGSCATEAELISRLRDVLHFEEEHAKRYLMQLSGRSAEQWEQEDAFLLPAEQDLS